LPEEIPPTEVVSMLHYATTLDPYLSLLLMERRSKYLQQMFYDAWDIQHNIQACEWIQNEGPNAQECESKYEREKVDWDLEHRINNIRGPLVVSYSNDSAKNYISPIERGGVDLSQDEQRDHCFLYSFIYGQEKEIKICLLKNRSMSLICSC
jgi:hypothetical protein